MTACRLLVVIGFLALLPGILSAEIYSYVDKDGVLYFSNVPTSPQYRYIGPEFSGSRYAAFPKGGPDDYDHIIAQASRLYNINFELIKAIIRVESNFDPNAVSPKGALGLMQLMPSNVKLFNVRNPFDPRENVMAGTRFFRQLLERYNSDLTLSLAAYNAGPGAVDRHRTVPPYRETRDYVDKVLRYYGLFRNAAQ
jgi:soluble lytic murein transglycosylase-like protein